MNAIEELMEYFLQGDADGWNGRIQRAGDAELLIERNAVAHGCVQAALTGLYV